MSYRICETLETEKQAMRDVYCQTMIDLANQNDRIVVMDADLMNSVGTVPSTGAIVTAENHSIYNGLGSAVAEVVAETCPVPLERVGVLDRFGQVGTVDYLREIYQLDAKTIYEKARKAIARKNQ